MFSAMQHAYRLWHLVRAWIAFEGRSSAKLPRPRRLPGHLGLGRPEWRGSVAPRLKGNGNRANAVPSSAPAARWGAVEEVEGNRCEERRGAQVVVGQAGQHRERVPALRPALAHPTPVAEAAVEKLEGLDVVARWRHVGIGADDHR